jgi:hypothetical protein
MTFAAVQHWFFGMQALLRLRKKMDGRQAVLQTAHFYSVAIQN